MVKEAELHAADDKKKRAVVEARNHGEALVHTTERTLKEHGDKISPSDKQAVEAAVADLRAVLSGDDVEAIKQKTDALTQASMKLGEAMYKAAPGGDGPPGDGGAAPGGGNGADESGVVDADFEEVDENRKGRSA
jgi:molecular chaperone DnaK